MSRSFVGRAVLPAIALTASLVLCAPGAAPARSPVQPAAPPVQPAAANSPITGVTDGLARQLAAAIRTPAIRAELAAAVQTGPADLAGLRLNAPLAAAIKAGNRAILVAKGLPSTAGSLLQVRLAQPELRGQLGQGRPPLVSATPTDDAAVSVTAYDPAGGQLTLDLARVPDRPVLLVEVNVDKAVPMGLRVVRDALAARHLTHTATTMSTTSSGGYWATMVNAVRLSNDEEPWIKGAAEIYSIVGGFGLDGHPTVDIVQMPYLDYDGITYYPNQLLVHFVAYKYNLADVVMMEDDGDTNYLSLAQALTTALLTIADVGVYAPLVNAILAAMPNSWWTDDPDYVDSWYTLSTASSGHYVGASANGWMDLSPYWVSTL